MTDVEYLECSKALARLAAATRERLDEGVIDVYLENPALVPTYPADVIVRTCRRLQAESEWFPKLKELLRGCQATLAADERAKTAKLLAEYEEQLPPRDLARRDRFLAELARMYGGPKLMPLAPPEDADQ